MKIVKTDLNNPLGTKVNTFQTTRHRTCRFAARLLDLRIRGLALGLFMTLFLIVSTNGSTASTVSNWVSTQQEGLLPVPSDKNLRASRKTVQSLFAKQYADRSNPGKAALAKLFLEQGLTTNDDPTAKFTLLQECIELSKAVGDCETAWSAVDALIGDFSIPAFDLQTEVIHDISKNVRDAALIDDLIVNCQKSIEIEIQNDQYKAAGDKARKLFSASKRGATREMSAEVAGLLKKIKKLKAAYTAIEADLNTLKEKPEDKSANQAVGEYHCFIKNNFKTGLPFLARGNLETTQSLAEKETKEGQTLEIGDQWWSLAESIPSHSKTIKKHAGKIYDEVLPSLKGITQKRVESRLESLLLTNQKEFAEKGIFASDWRFNWTVDGQPEWTRVRFLPDGTMQRSIAIQSKPWTYQWRATSKGIFVPATPTAHFLFLQNESGGLIATKFDPKSGKELETIKGLRLERE